MTIGQIIRDNRKRMNLTQGELGELAGTGINLVSQLERGRNSVRFDKLLSILRVLGLEITVSRGNAGHIRFLEGSQGGN